MRTQNIFYGEMCSVFPKFSPILHYLELKMSYWCVYLYIGRSIRNILGHFIDTRTKHKRASLLLSIRKWYSPHRQTVKAQVSLRICAVSTEPSLFAHMTHGPRGDFRQNTKDLAFEVLLIWVFKDHIWATPREKSVFGGLQPGKTQTSLFSCSS